MKIPLKKFNFSKHLKINKFTDSLICERVSLGKQRLNSLLHICNEGPDREQSDATNSLERWTGDKVLRQNQSERKICKARSKKEKLQLSQILLIVNRIFKFALLLMF